MWPNLQFSVDLVTFTESFMDNFIVCAVKYVKDIPENIKEKLNIHGRDFSIKTFTMKYPKFSLVRITVNSWKKVQRWWECSYKKIRRPNLLDFSLLKKVKSVALGTRMAGGVIKQCGLLERLWLWSSFNWYMG